MAQPTIEGMTLNAGSGGFDLAYDTVDSKAWQAILCGYSTGDGSANVVMADTGLPVVAETGATWACTQSGTWNVTNISGTISLPTGAATAALQTTGNGILTTIDADTGNIATSTAACATDLAAIEVLITAGNVDLAAMVVDLAAIEVTQDSIALSATAINADTTAIQTAVEIMDDWDDGSDHCEVVGAAAEDAAASGAPVLVGGRYDSTARTLDTGDVGAPALSSAGEVISIPQIKFVMYGAERCQVKHFEETTSTTGQDLIAAPGAGKKILVLSMAINATSATVTNVHWQTGTTNTDIWFTGTAPLPVALDADGDNVAGCVWANEMGLFTTPDANEALEIILSAAQAVKCSGTYIEYTA